LIDRRSRWPRRVPYRALEQCNSPTARCGQDQLAFVDNESHINVRVEARERRRAAASPLTALLESCELLLEKSIYFGGLFHCEYDKTLPIVLAAAAK
jgi:hypothetical protein